MVNLHFALPSIQHAYAYMHTTNDGGLLSFAPTLLACKLIRGATSTMLAAPARDTSKSAEGPLGKTERTSVILIYVFNLQKTRYKKYTEYITKYTLAKLILSKS